MIAKINKQILINTKEDYFFFKVQFNQNIYDLGLFSEEDSIKDVTFNLNDYFISGDIISGVTSSLLENFRTYNSNNPYVVNFDINKSNYFNYSGASINGVSRITKINGNDYEYAVDGNNDLNIGTTNQLNGIFYKETKNSGKANFRFKSEGFNLTNSKYSSIFKEDYLMGVINKPEVINDIFIDRGNISVFESHLKMSEIESLDHLEKYGNGFFNNLNSTNNIN